MLRTLMAGLLACAVTRGTMAETDGPPTPNYDVEKFCEAAKSGLKECLHYQYLMGGLVGAAWPSTKPEVRTKCIKVAEPWQDYELLSKCVSTHYYDR